ncbi:MAG TPA: GNAT family N-acetyltransferase [Burkholderiaceae bacterium]
MSPLLRPAAEDDLAAITAIYALQVRTGTASFELEPPSEAQMRQRFDAVRGAGLPYLAALLDGRLVGYAYASSFRPRPGYRFTVEDSVYVDPGATGRGVGRQLLQRLIDECSALGLRQMLAVIGDSGNLASIALHRSCGFEQAGVLHAIGFKFGRWLDVVLMQRALAPAPERAP